MNRRSFVKGASVGILSALSLGLTACDGDVSTPTPTQDDSVAVNDIWKLDELAEASESLLCDLVIIGAGGTGMAAAIQAKQMGLEPILIEKMGELGGAYICTEGMAAFGSSMQIAAGIDIPIEDAIDQCMVFHHWLPDRSLYKAFFDVSAETVDWCIDLGVEYSGVVTQAGGKSLEDFHVWHHLEGRSPGAQPVETFISAIDELGIQVLRDASAKKIVKTNGKVILALRRVGRSVPDDLRQRRWSHT
jgi:fumarate reductase flavoprotein subunit